MIRFERTYDYALIKAVMSHPKLYSRMADDFSPLREAFEPLESPHIWYVKVSEDDKLLGIWVLIPHSKIEFEIHTCLLPESWGEPAFVASIGFSQWIWENTDCVSLTTNVPEFNRTALYFARRAGMWDWGRKLKSFSKGGRLYDQILLGMVRPGVE